jgi:hypothetical protein
MKILGSNNGKFGVEVLKTSAKRVAGEDKDAVVRPDILVKTIYRNGELLTNFFFNGSWKTLNLDNNGIVMGLNDDDTFVQVATLPHTDKRVSSFKLTTKSSNKKSRSFKSDNFAALLGQAGLIVSPTTVEGFVEGMSYNQNLSLEPTEPTEAEIAEGVIAAYKVVPSTIPASLEATREVPQERIDAIMSKRAVTLAAKKEAKALEVEPVANVQEVQDAVTGYQDTDNA